MQIVASQTRPSAIEKTARDTIQRAASETYYKDAAKEMYTGLASLSNVAVTTPGDSPDLVEKLSDINSIAKQADGYAHRQQYYQEAAPILYQALDDVALIAHGGNGTGSEKLQTASAILEHAENRAHQWTKYSQATVGMYQALADLQQVARHQDPAVNGEETGKLDSLTRMAQTVSANAAKQPYWNGAAQVLYAGIDSIQAMLG